MRCIADLHIHSLFSRATSKSSHLRGLAAWAAVKGIDLVATGDFTHPGWFAHLYEELMPAEPGLFRLKPDPLYDYAALLPEGLCPERHPEEIRFMLGTEISCIYKRAGRVRKVHNLIYAPDMQAVRRINAKLGDLGNISSDGRPILGLDSHDLLEIVLEQSADAFLIPAHIWTPWFSLFGSRSGFDRIEDCFADLTPHIFALETGLSSDPDMNRLLSALDPYTLVSNSDCHSPARLGREANIFDIDLDYFALREAIRTPRDAEGRQRMVATVEFFPEEGKYHADGHRKCGVCLEPQKTKELGGLCPVCGRALTVGVLHRVLELADRSVPRYPEGSPAVRRLVPLPELVAELLGLGPASARVCSAWVRLVNTFGSEFRLLLDTPLEDMKAFGLLAEAVSRVRRDAVQRQPGYDGEFGRMRVFAEGERERLGGQQSLFPAESAPRNIRKKRSLLLSAPAAGALAPADAGPQPRRLNEAQQAAVMSSAPVILVQAGPGTGKTHTLASRVARLLEDGHTVCTVITFTNKAADELKCRLQPERRDTCRISTFHGYCLGLLRLERPGLAVAGPEERGGVLAGLFPEMNGRERAQADERIGRFLLADEASAPPEVQRYLEELAAHRLVDLDDVCRQALALFRKGGRFADRLRKLTGMLFVDEFQDVNAVQYALVAEVAKTNPVFCIGDPDQSIYGFRGASPRWFYRLMEDFAAERHVLSQNYRSGAAIVQAAAAVIRHNPHELSLAAPESLADNEAKIHLQSCQGALDEARFIADQIEAQTGGLSHRGVERMDGEAAAGVSLGDIAVLYRNLRLASAVEKVFAERGIPFRQVELSAWYMQGACRLLSSWLMLAASGDGVDQMLFLLGQEAGLGAVRLGQAQALLRGSREAGLPGLLDALAGMRTAPAGFLHLAQEVAALAEGDRPLPELVDTLIGFLAAHYGKAFAPEDARVLRLRENAVSFPDLPAFAANLERYRDSVLYDPKAQAVTLSTLHAAKGLEFDVVFLCACEQGILPGAPRETLDEAGLQAHLEEERRLFYVGMTRARRTLYCTWCALRHGFGQTGPEPGPSPFLFEFSPELLSPAPIIRPAARKKRARLRQLALFADRKPDE